MLILSFLFVDALRNSIKRQIGQEKAVHFSQQIRVLMIPPGTCKTDVSLTSDIVHKPP